MKPFDESNKIDALLQELERQYPMMKNVPAWSKLSAALNGLAFELGAKVDQARRYTGHQSFDWPAE